MGSNNRVRFALRALGWSLAVTLLGGVASSGQAQSPVGTAQVDPKPVIMLLVDTSGSMERMPTSSTSTLEFPDCASSDPSDKVNRWSITLQSLTGTFTSVGCTEEDRGASPYDSSDYDYGYIHPHYRPTIAGQNDTGVLDTYKERAKFGLMTFDSVATYVQGPIFVPFADFDLSASSGAQGMYSYGETKKLVFPGCNTPYAINNGARNDGASITPAPAGRLISPGPSEDANDVAAVNQAIQEALLGTPAESYRDGVRPFGGTPVAGMLDDLKVFFETDAELGVTNDPYGACRDRTAILITDGAPDSDFREDRFDCDADPTSCQADAGEDCVCPYDLPVNYVEELCELTGDGECDPDAVLNRGFHVVALSLAADDDALVELNELAAAGGTTEAHLADDGAELDAALSEIIDYANPDATTRVAPVVYTSALGQMSELKAGFRIPAGGGTWQGVLERKRWVCENMVPTQQELTNDDTDGLTPRDILHEWLDRPTLSLADRNLQVIATAQADAYDFVKSGHVVTSDAYPQDNILNRLGVLDPVQGDSSGDSTHGTSETLVQTVTELVSLNAVGDLGDSLLSALGMDGVGGVVGGLIGDLSGDGTTDKEDVLQAYQWLAGENDTRDSRMGAVYHSQPVVVAPPSANTTNEALNTFFSLLQNQPEVAIVATGDGLLRAFSLEVDAFPEVLATETADAESALGLAAGDLAVADIASGDEIWAIAPPAALASLADAAAGTTLLFDGSPIVRTVATSRESTATSGAQYRRIMIAALRGLPAYVAFDITNVTKPKFMWQFSHPKLGQTTGEPVVAQIDLVWNDSTTQNRAIALFPGGEGESEATCDGGGVNGSGDNYTGGLVMPNGLPRRAATVDDFGCWREVGRYLYAVDVLTGSLVQVFDHNFFAAPLTGGLAVDAGDLGLTATAGYVTDEDGILYRIDFGNPNPASWKVEAIYDLFHQAPANTTFGGRPAIHPPIVRPGPAGETVIVLATGDIDNATDTMEHRVASISEYFDGLGALSHKENWNLKLGEAESVTGELVYFNETIYFASFVANTDPGNKCSVGESRIWGVDYVENDGANQPGPLGRLPNLQGGSTDVTYYDSTVLPSIAGQLVVGLSLTQQPTCLADEFGTDAYLGNRYLPGQPAGGAFSLSAVTNGGTNTSGGNSSFNQVDVVPNLTQNRAVTRITGGFGSVLE